MEIDDWAYGPEQTMGAVKDVTIRAVKTFVQTFLAAFPVADALELNVSSFKAAAFGAGSAGIAVIWNALNAWSSR